MYFGKILNDFDFFKLVIIVVLNTNLLLILLHITLRSSICVFFNGHIFSDFLGLI